MEEKKKEIMEIFWLIVKNQIKCGSKNPYVFRSLIDVYMDENVIYWG
jgi:hypothetical protein